MKSKRFRLSPAQALPPARRYRRKTGSRYRYGDIELDPARRIAWCAGRPVRLTPRETALLAMFLAAPGRVLTRAELLAGAWQAPGALRTRTVDMHVRLLRKKLGEHQRIVTVHRRGYRWD